MLGKILFKILFVLIIGFWITSLSMWALPQVVEDTGSDSSVLIWALGIFLIDFYLICWALNLFDGKEQMKGGTQ